MREEEGRETGRKGERVEKGVREEERGVREEERGWRDRGRRE